MTRGEQLYVMYSDLCMELNNCIVDDWSDLDASEQLVWEELSKLVHVVEVK